MLSVNSRLNAERASKALTKKYRWTEQHHSRQSQVTRASRTETYTQAEGMGMSRWAIASVLDCLCALNFVRFGRPNNVAYSCFLLILHSTGT